LKSIPRVSTRGLGTLFFNQQPRFNTAHAFILPTGLALYGEVVDFSSQIMDRRIHAMINLDYSRDTSVFMLRFFIYFDNFSLIYAALFLKIFILDRLSHEGLYK